MWKCPWTLLVVLACVSGEYLMGGHLDNNSGAKSGSEKIDNSFPLERKRHVDDLDPDLVAEESTVGAVAGATASSTSIDNDVPRYHIPSYPFAFNGGKPFSLEKDPITGKIDFEKAPPVRALNYTGRYQEHENEREKENVNISEEGDGEEDAYAKHGKTGGNGNDKDDDVSPNEINANTVNFHDFLHLPVNYSSDKYGNNKYPLISNSYANMKVQSGANSYSTNNHRPYLYETSDSYTHSNLYAPMMNTSAIYNATIVSGFKAKLSTVAYPVKFSTSRAPVVTTWKPSTTPTVLDSVNRILSVAEKENEESVLSVERLHISSHVAGYKNPSDIPTGPNDKTTERAQTVTRYKNQPTRNNLVSSHSEVEAKPYEAQYEEYHEDSLRDTYDVYESPGDEGEDGVGVEGEIDDDDEESNLPFPDLPRKQAMQSTPSATAANAMASTASTTADTVTTLSKGITSAVTTIAPFGSVSSTQHMILHAGNSPQFPIISQAYPKTTSSSLIGNLGQSTVDHYDPNTSHEYKTVIKSERDRVGDGIVIESTSNIVIPPDQNTVSFVLGNRQNVEGGYYSVGTAIGENPYGSLSDTDTSFWPLRNNPHGPVKKIKYDQPVVSVAEPDRVATQKWWVPGASVLKSSDELEPPRSQSSFAAVAAPAASVATVDTNKSRSEGKISGHVIFPDVETKDKDTITKEHMVVVNEANDTRELPSRATLTTTIGTTTTTVATSKTRINFPSANAGEDLPQLAESLMPPAESSIPPPYYYQYQYDTNLRPERTRLPQRLPPPPPPPPPRIKPGFSGSPLDVGSRRRPYSPEAKLPNILPQFRPNTKTSHGHRFGSDVIGTLPAGQSLPSRIRQPLQNHPPSRRPLPPPPSYLQRLNPPPPPIHAVRLAFVPTPKVDGAASLHETEPTIRKFRPPHMSAISRGNTEENAQLFNKSFDRVTEQDEYETTRMRDQGKSAVVDERENESSERYPEEPPMTPPRPPLFPKRRTADPQHVTTLQMIQHHGEFVDNDESEAKLTQQPVEPVLAYQAERRKSDNHDLLETAEQPVYVVYPVNTAVNIHPDNSREDADADADVDVDADDSVGDASVVVGTRGPHRPLPPDTLLQEEREKAHAVYNARPVPVALDFPYPLEHPDLTSMFPVAGTKETPLLVPSEQRQQTVLAGEGMNQGNEQNEQDATNVIPYLQDFLPYQKKNDATISVTLHRTGPILTSSSTATPTLIPASASTSASASTPTPTPIAYVYTPTRAAAYPIRHLDDDADTSIDATATVLPSSQRPSSSSNSAPTPQNFMAPFVASISAEAPSKNGWNVVVIEPPLEADQKLDGDNDGANLTNSEMDTSQTERNDFDADNFKPQLFGGFKPIYEFPAEYMERRDDTNFETDTSRHPKGLTVPGKR